MSDIAIEFDHVGKLYRLKRVGSGTLSHDLNRWWQTRVLGHEDPFLKIGEVNDRAHKGTSDYIWALKDIDFSVKQGEVVGIIGKNGAGKSTLLKLLSRVTGPTVGQSRTRGRIASLLEVGTGFHPEMTGRENIYMNGAIMGMTKAEIGRKLDEIVDFAGIERYLDTPVKRYSSGMTVRLGFAVAAFLEPEILVVDEVLAVGDAEFQKKAIGRMQDISRGEGRTVLFVSHNMAAVRSLCQRGIVLENGEMVFDGSAEDSVNFYTETNINTLRAHSSEKDLVRTGILARELQVVDVKILNNIECVSTEEPLVFEVSFKRNSPEIRHFQLGVQAINESDVLIWVCFSPSLELPEMGNLFTVRMTIPNHHTPKGRYNMNFFLSRFDYSSSLRNYDIVRRAVSFEVCFADCKHTSPFVVWPYHRGSAIQESRIVLINV